MTNKELFALCALRYAIGRRTYIVGVVCGEFRDLVNLGSLSRRAIEQAITEIDNEEAIGCLGDEWDASEWVALRVWLKEELEKEEI